MAAVFSSEPEERVLSGLRATESCSVCLDAVNDSGERSIAKLKCGHYFHLDCIGSAFNAKGAMQCPNCRHVEDGQWLYANGLRWTDDLSIEEIYYDDEYEPLQALPARDIFSWIPSEYPIVNHQMPRSDTNLGVSPQGHYDWCPYQHGTSQPGGSSYPQFQVSIGDRDNSVEYADMLGNLAYVPHESGSASSSLLCPHVVAHGFVRSRHPTVLDGARSRGAHGPSRLPDSAATSNSGSIAGDRVGVFSAQNRDIWSGRSARGPSISGYSEATPVADPSRFAEMDLSWTNLGSFYGDVGIPGLSSIERLRSWSDLERETGLTSTSFGAFFGPTSGHFSYSGLYMDGTTLPPGPCPRPYAINGSVAAHNQSQLGAIGNSRRGRSGGVSSPFMASGSDPGPISDQGNRSTGSASFHDIVADLPDRRAGESWNAIDPVLGEEPPVPGLEESHGYYYQGWRRDYGSGSSGDHWTMWRPAGRLAADMESTSLSRADLSGALDGGLLPPSADRQGDISGIPVYMNYSEPYQSERITDVGSLSLHSFFRPQS